VLHLALREITGGTPVPLADAAESNDSENVRLYWLLVSSKGSVYFFRVRLVKNVE